MAMSAETIRAEVFQILALAQVTYSAEYRGLSKPFDGKNEMDAWRCTFTRAGRAPQEFEFYTGKGLRAEPNQTQRKPAAPHPADVLHSIIMDSSASAQSFESWCDEYGYDSDSRKALSTYEACQRNADRLAKVLDTATRRTLSTTLQDY